MSVSCDICSSTHLESKIFDGHRKPLISFFTVAFRIYCVLGRRQAGGVQEAGSCLHAKHPSFLPQSHGPDDASNLASNLAGHSFHPPKRIVHESQRTCKLRTSKKTTSNPSTWTRKRKGSRRGVGQSLGRDIGSRERVAQAAKREESSVPKNCQLAAHAVVWASIVTTLFPRRRRYHHLARRWPTLLRLLPLRIYDSFITFSLPRIQNCRMVWLRCGKTSPHCRTRFGTQTIPRPNEVENTDPIQYDFLAHALLGLAAERLATSTSSNYSLQALHHRVRAITAMNEALSTPCVSALDADARLATAIALTFQSTYMEDGMMEFLRTLRGWMVIQTSIVPSMAQSLFRDFTEEAYIGSKRTLLGRAQACDSSSFLHHQGLDGALDDLEASLHLVTPLCRTRGELEYLSSLQRIALLARTSPRDGKFTTLSISILAELDKKYSLSRTGAHVCNDQRDGRGGICTLCKRNKSDCSDPSCTLLDDGLAPGFACVRAGKWVRLGREHCPLLGRASGKTTSREPPEIRSLATWDEQAPTVRTGRTRRMRNVVEFPTESEQERF